MSNSKNTPKPKAKPQAAKAEPTEKKPIIPKAPAGTSHTARHGLGRGLGGLISAVPKAATPAPAAQAAAPVAAPQPSAEPAKQPAPAAQSAARQDEKSRVLDVPVAEIERSPWQPRQVFDQEALKTLSESIKLNGMINPLICRINADRKYELIGGERRLRAAIDAGLTKVPVLLVDVPDNRRAAEFAIIDNIQRAELNVIEEAEGYRTLIENFNLTQAEVADRVGRARPTVTNLMRLLELPDEVKQMVGSGFISTGHAKILLSLPNQTDQTLIGRKIVNEGISVRQLEKLVEQRIHPDREMSRRPATPDLPETYVRDLSDKLHRHFGTSIRLTSGMTHANGRHTKGRIEIDFYDNDDLDRLLSLFGVSVN